LLLGLSAQNLQRTGNRLAAIADALDLLLPFNSHFSQSLLTRLGKLLLLLRRHPCSFFLAGLQGCHLLLLRCGSQFPLPCNRIKLGLTFCC
jgi:hypothetical protein